LVGTTIPELKGGFKRMTMLDPHPANNTFSSSLMSYDSTSVLGWVFAMVTNLFQDAASDPQVVVPPNADQAEVYYQHTDHNDTPSLGEQILNLWGENTVRIDPQFTGLYKKCDLTGSGIGHSEVHDRYQVNVVNPNLVDDWPPFCPTVSPSPSPSSPSDVDLLYPNYVDKRGLAQSLVSQLASAKAAYQSGDIATTVSILTNFIQHVQAQTGKHITQEAAQVLVPMAQLLVQELTSSVSTTVSVAMSAPWSGGISSVGGHALKGPNRRDLLIGRTGADKVYDRESDTLLIGGTTHFERPDAALVLAMAEWTSPNDYATRIANLLGTGSGPSFGNRLNGNYFLQADVTVFDDGAQDQLTGSAGQDWVLRQPNRFGRAR
jgi:hypothetical protein